MSMAPTEMIITMRAIDGQIFNVLKEDIRAVLERVAMDGHIQICQPEEPSIDAHVAPSINTEQSEMPDTYSKEENDDMVNEVYKSQDITLEDCYRRLDDLYYLIDSNLNMLTQRMDEMKKKFDEIKRQHMIGSTVLASIDAKTGPSIDYEKAVRQDKLVTKNFLEEKLHEITFSQEVIK